MRSRLRAVSVIVALSTLVVGLSTVASGALRTSVATPRLLTHTITLKLPAPFRPVAPKGSTDLYHCSLLDPKITTDQMIVKSTFVPGHLSEVHHAILYLVPKALASIARSADDHGRGWTCFGGPAAPGAGQALGNFGNSIWLAGWSPGRGSNFEPAGTGVPLPAGSLIVMQVHYNLLAGSYPDQSKAVFTTVDAKGSGLLPLTLKLLPAPINMPCPAGVTGALCSRSRSLADIGRRFGQSAVDFDNGLQAVCSKSSPRPGDTASCTWPVFGSYRLLAITPHMHLLGLTMTVTLDPGTSKSKVLLNVPNYDFHYQRSYDVTPITLNSSDTVQVSCTFDPKLRGELPYLKNLPPRYVLWADGSSDEMCLAIMSVVSTSAVPMARVKSSAQTPNISWPSELNQAIANFEATPGESEAARNSLLAQITSHLAHCGL